MYHSFLNDSSADGHLGCFHVLAFINNAVVNTGVHMSLSILVSSVCMPSSGIAGLYAIPFSTDLSSSGIELWSLVLQADYLLSELPGKPVNSF